MFDGPIEELKRRLWDQSTIKFDVRDRELRARMEALTIPGVTVERAGELTCRPHFARETCTSAEVVKQIYSGSLFAEPVA